MNIYKDSFHKKCMGKLTVGLAGLGIAITGMFAVDKLLEKQMLKVSKEPYEATIGDLIQHPDLFDNAYVYVFEEEHTNPVARGVSYRVTARYSIDTENFVRPRFILNFSVPDGGELPSKYRELAYRGSVEGLRRYVSENAEKLSPEISQKILSELEMYANWDWARGSFLTSLFY